MIEGIIAIILLIAGIGTGDTGYFIASGIFTIAGDILYLAKYGRRIGNDNY